MRLYRKKYGFIDTGGFPRTAVLSVIAHTDESALEKLDGAARKYLGTRQTWDGKVCESRLRVDDVHFEFPGGGGI